MFERPHHQRIARVLSAMDGDLLADARCYFGGGTAISLLLGEYRESVDIDFLCADIDGYRILRTALQPPMLGRLLKSPMPHLRDVRTQRDKISTILDVEGAPVRVEFVLEARIPISGMMDPGLGVPLLAREDMYAEKLLANVDRALDRSQLSRDLIDLSMMIAAWGPVPAAALAKAELVYGNAVRDYFVKGLDMLRAPGYRAECLKAMAMEATLSDSILFHLQSSPLATRDT